MPKRRTSRRRRSRRPARRRTTRRNRRRSSRRRTSKRRTRRNSRRLKVYLYYRTPGGQKKLKNLGSGAAARAAYKNWRAKVRGKGYRTLKKVRAASMASARSKVAPKKRTRRRR